MSEQWQSHDGTFWSWRPLDRIWVIAAFTVHVAVQHQAVFSERLTIREG